MIRLAKILSELKRYKKAYEILMGYYVRNCWRPNNTKRRYVHEQLKKIDL